MLTNVYIVPLVDILHLRIWSVIIVLSRMIAIKNCYNNYYMPATAKYSKYYYSTSWHVLWCHKPDIRECFPPFSCTLACMRSRQSSSKSRVHHRRQKQGGQRGTCPPDLAEQGGTGGHWFSGQCWGSSWQIASTSSPFIQLAICY